MPTTSNFGWTTPADTDLVKDGAAAIRTLGNGIDASLLDLKGGTSGQVLSKNSNTDLDYTWVTPNVGDITEVQAGTGISVASGTGPIPVVTNTVATAFDAKGDLVAGTGADTFATLTVGANNTVLTADSTTATGLKWAAAAGGGKILQVVQGFKDDSFTTSSDSFVDVTSLSVSITPSSASSKVLVFLQMNVTGGVAQNTAYVQLVRGSTAIDIGAAAGSRTRVTGMAYNAEGDVYESVNAVYLDSPATTSATTYKVQVRRNTALGAVYVNRSGTDNDNANTSRAASNIVVMEVGA